MPSHVWSLICLNTILDRDSNNVSLINVLEELAISPAPTVEDLGDAGYVMLPIPVVLVSLWERADEDVSEKFEFRIKVKGPDDQPVGPATPTQEWVVDQLRLRTRARLMTVPFSTFGRYEYIVQYRSDSSDRWKQAARIPLTIKAP